MVVEARLDLADFLAEAEHDAHLVRLDTEKPGNAPQHDGAERDQSKAAAAHIAARENAPELVLAAPQQIFEVRRRRSGRLRPGPPRSLRSARSPRSAALIAPWHENSPRRPATRRWSVLLLRLYWSRPRLTTHAADAVQRAGATAVSLPPVLSPDISGIAESGLVFRTRRMFAPSRFAPNIGIDRWKVRIARRVRMHMGNLDTVGKGHG